jgi:hypothetical protein
MSSHDEDLIRYIHGILTPTSTMHSFLGFQGMIRCFCVVDLGVDPES